MQNSLCFKYTKYVPSSILKVWNCYLHAVHHQRNYIFIFKGTIQLVSFKSGSELGKKLAIE